MKLAAVALLLLFAAAADARSLHILHKLSKGIQYCDPYAHHDGCGKHGLWHKYECVKLDHEEGCSYKEECTYKNGPCKSYKYKDFCESVKGGCKVYEQVEKCDEKQVCKSYGKCQPVEPPCEAYDANEKCVKYGPSQACTSEEVCVQYETKKENCKYVDTDKCKEYYYGQECKQVKDKCEVYEQVQECKKVKVGCKKGKCVKKILGHFKKG